MRAAPVVPTVPIAATGPGKSETPDLTESKPSFGDKQKPLYHMPLKWRKVIGKPQVRCEAWAFGSLFFVFFLDFDVPCLLRHHSTPLAS